MYVIGLTGGVGSGKTEAARLLQKISGAELLLADELGHLVMKKGTQGYEKILKCFGNEILAADGDIDRKHLSELVFYDSEKLKILNDIVHPAVLSYMDAHIRERSEKQGLLILESAIMFESGCDRLCDEVWYISVPRKIRERRLLESRGYSAEKSSSIIKKQMEEEEYRMRCVAEIRNDGTFQDLEDRLNDLCKKRKIDIGFQKGSEKQEKKSEKIKRELL